jgi:hypothetical protein
MKFSFYKVERLYDSLEFFAHLPTLQYNKRHQVDVGEVYYKTKLDFTTKLCIIHTSTKFDFLITILGIGISFHIREYNGTKGS